MYRLRLISTEAKIAIMAMLTLLSFLTSNPLLTVACMMVIPFFLLLIRKNELPVLFVAMVYQWIAISIKVFFADAKGLDFLYYHDFPAHIFEALFLSLIGLSTLITGIWLIIRTNKPVSDERLSELITNIDLRKLLLIYGLYSLLVTLVGTAFLSFGGFAQITYILLQFKWSFYLLLFLVVFRVDDKKYKLLLWLIVLGEVVLGFASYFSSFKEILIFTFIGLLATLKRVSFKRSAVLLFFAGVVFYMGIIWTAIKPEYRMYLSGGERQQIVTVSKSEAIDKFFELATSISDDVIDRSQFFLIDRISYIDYFSGAISYVPEIVPHEKGKVWSDAIMHVLMPRLFFPEKEAIDDSKHLTKYTGVYFATAEQGASFSLGYMADSYVDFGSTFMFVPLFLLGLLIGSIYKYFINNGYNQLWGIVLVVPLFYFAGTYEVSSIKLFGRLITYFLVFFIINKFALHRVNKLITK